VRAVQGHPCPFVASDNAPNLRVSHVQPVCYTCGPRPACHFEFKEVSLKGVGEGQTCAGHLARPGQGTHG
jgi:hypothetical protein